MPRRRTFTLLLWLAPTLAHAQGGFRFDWTVPEGCPTREQVVIRAEQLLGRALDGAAPTDLTLDGRVTRLGESEWQLALSQRSSTGSEQRQVKAARCDELAEAAALLIALSIDPSLTGPPSTPTTSAFPGETEPAATIEKPEAAGEVKSPDPAAPVHPVPVVPSSPWRLRGGATFAAWSRRLPGLAPGIAAHAGMASRHWVVLGELGFFPPRHASVPASAAGGDLFMASGGGQLGYLWQLHRLGLGPIAGAELQWLHGEGANVDAPQSADVMLVSVQAGARVSLVFSRSWALVAGAAVALPVNRPRFVVDGVGPVHRPDAWGVRFGFGVEWQQP
jgi:hypothetical protein